MRAGAAVAPGVALLAGGLQLEERPLPIPAVAGEVPALPGERPLWVRFPGESLEKVGQLRLDGRALTEAADYPIPYVPSDLKLLLGAHAQGAKLTARPEAGIKTTPQLGNYRWAWRREGRRLTRH